MALFEKSKTQQDRKTQRLMTNIRSLYEDALGYSQLSEQFSDTPDVLDLEQVMFTDEVQPEDASRPDSRKNPADLKTPVRTSSSLVDDDENFDRLLFRLMKDVREADQRLPADKTPRDVLRNEAEPYLDMSQQPARQPQQPASQPRQPYQERQTSSLDLSPYVRDSLRQLVYEQIEERIKLWIDENLEQIVEDALRYAPAGSRDSRKDYDPRS